MKKDLFNNIFLRQMMFLWLLFLGCNQSVSEVDIPSGEIATIIADMTDLMVHDVTNPPLAARFYAYATLSGLEALRTSDPHIANLLGIIKNYNTLVDAHSLRENVHPQVAALFAMYYTAGKLQPSGYEMQEKIKLLENRLKNSGISEKVIRSSATYGHRISDHVLDYAAHDRYNQTSNSVRYSPSDSPGSWYPTPPGYFPPVEPYFGTLRPFILDTANQFSPAPATPYSEDQDSPFQIMLREVYELELDQSKKEIASFWDCNPFALEDKGHLMIGLKKISPGAHWMGIANIACKDAGLTFEQTLEINTVLALTMHDAFIACWREKYSSNRIRPESVIRKLLDPRYAPLLQTPPFPEYLSGHSVISTASAVVLTRYFGDGFAYTDTVEVKFGLPARTFESFEAAAAEASISRLYGGIHFRDAIEEGQNQGRAIGNFAMEKINPRLFIK